MGKSQQTFSKKRKEKKTFKSDIQDKLAKREEEGLIQKRHLKSLSLTLTKMEILRILHLTNQKDLL